MHLKQTYLRIFAVVITILLVFAIFFTTNLFISEKNIKSVNKNLSDYWDFDTVQYNPDKGIYQHYYDQGIYTYCNYVATKYELEQVKGMDHLYFRFPWVQVNPNEGEYDWSVLDSTMEEFADTDYKFAMCIYSKDTNPEFIYATPEWVKDKGATGTMAGTEGEWDYAWEPDYGNSVFLEELDTFIKEFAKKYDGDPRISYIDIGSFGDWGEGHTSFGSKKSYPVEVRKAHIDTYTKYFTETQLVISDDFLTDRLDANDQAEMLAYADAKNIALGDDSILVNWYSETCYDTGTVAHPDLFEQMYDNGAVVLEMEHYKYIDKQYWSGVNGSEEGLTQLQKAIELMHATYLSFHGSVNHWLNDNPNVTDLVYNRLGYWYFIRNIVHDNKVVAGNSTNITLEWVNKGVAPAYQNYPVTIKLVNSNCEVVMTETNPQNTTWDSDTINTVSYTVNVPDDTTPGTYKIVISMKNQDGIPIKLGMSESLLESKDSYSYVLSEISVID